MSFRNRRAFTLIELLVVIAIIGTLIAILLPALHHARKVARLAICTSNMKGLGVAMAAYLSENRFVYPTAGGLASPQAAPYYVDVVGATGAFSPWNDSETRLLNRYMTEFTQSVRCPLDAGDSSYAGSREPLWYIAGASYGYLDRTPMEVFNNTRVVRFGIWSIEGVKESLVLKPSMKLIMSESPLYDPLLRPASNSQNCWHSSTEPLFANILFGDGHVNNQARKVNALQTVPFSTTDDQLLSTNQYY